ncbi:MAG: NAD(P)/FAD-dependent oxidoreductase [Candidatus Acidiferrales bacterium]
MRQSAPNSNWGMPPWTIDFRPARRPLPRRVDFAVVGGGFAGLAAAAWLRRLAPERSVAVFEARSIGAGSSGHTGGLVLAETAAGDLPGLGDVLSVYSTILRELEVDGDLALPGVWEIGRTSPMPDSPISWTDSGSLRAMRQVPGGEVDPGKAVSGLARAAEKSGVHIIENSPVESVEFEDDLARLRVPGGEISAGAVLLATNAMSFELADISGEAQPKFTLAIATEPLSSSQIDALGLADGKPFYTVDFPYLWGRRLRTAGLVFGAGLVHLGDWRGLEELNITRGEAAKLIARLEGRVRALHPVLNQVRITHRWGGPILIANSWRPVFMRHPRSRRSIVLCAFSGHGVALSVYLGAWAAEALCGRKELPDWNSSGETE